MPRPNVAGHCFCCARDSLTAPLMVLGADGQTGICNDCFDEVVKAGMLWRLDYDISAGSIRQNAATTLRLQ